MFIATQLTIGLSKSKLQKEDLFLNLSKGMEFIEYFMPL